MEENEYYTIPEAQLCRKCHIRRIDQSENSNSILCRECREEQIKYPFPKKMLPVVALVVVLMVVALIKVPKTLGYYKMYQTSRTEAEAGEIYSALVGMMEVVEAYPDSVPVAERAIELAMGYGYYDFAAYLIDQYMVGKEVNDSTYAKMNMYTDKLSRYYNTFDKMEEINQKIDPSLEQEEILPRIREELLACVDDRELYPALIYYYLGNLSEDSVEAEKYLEASIKADNRLTMASTSLGTVKRRRGDLEGARELYESVLKQDKSDPGALRAMGILMLLMGDKEQGLETVRAAYEESPETAYVKETLIIALMENGKIDEAESLKQQFTNEGEVFDESFEQYLNGEVDLYHYYEDVE